MAAAATATERRVKLFMARVLRWLIVYLCTVVLFFFL